MKIVYILMALFGIWFLASAATVDGLLPSGHGSGVWSEIIFGVALLGFAAFKLFKREPSA